MNTFFPCIVFVMIILIFSCLISTSNIVFKKSLLRKKQYQGESFNISAYDFICYKCGLKILTGQKRMEVTEQQKECAHNDRDQRNSFKLNTVNLIIKNELKEQ